MYDYAIQSIDTPYFLLIFLPPCEWPGCDLFAEKDGKQQAGSVGTALEPELGEQLCAFQEALLVITPHQAIHAPWQWPSNASSSRRHAAVREQESPSPVQAASPPAGCTSARVGAEIPGRGRGQLLTCSCLYCVQPESSRPSHPPSSLPRWPPKSVSARSRWGWSEYTHFCLSIHSAFIKGTVNDATTFPPPVRRSLYFSTLAGFLADAMATESWLE